MREIAARTEQYWCPIKHAQRVAGSHGHYSHFLDYGDAESYHDKLEQVRYDFDRPKKKKAETVGKKEKIS